MDTAGWSGGNEPSPDHLPPALRREGPCRPENGEFQGHALILPLPARHQYQSPSPSCRRPCYTCISGWMRGSIRPFPLCNLVVFQRLQLALDVNAVEPGDVAANDLLLDLISEIHSIFGFQVVWQLKGHKVIEQPVRVPDG